MPGRKIISKYENPIDDVLISICEKIGPFFKRLGFTPNILTTCSLVITIIGIYCLYKKKYELSGILYFIGYFFDCFDGNFARRYNMVTTFGDYYDHISDIMKYILLIIIIIISDLKIYTKILFNSILLFSVPFMFIHLGCQENFYDKESILTHNKKYCKDPGMIKYTKYFGCGTWMLLLSLMIIFLEKINKIM